MDERLEQSEATRHPRAMTGRIFGAFTYLGVLIAGCTDGRRAQHAHQVEVPEGGLCTRCGACEEQLSVRSASHVEGDLTYADSPPTSGDHNACWAEWGVHEQALRPENWVHNLEHGGVVFLYHCETGCETEVETLTRLVESRDRALLTRYDALPTKFAVVSWGHRLLSDCLDQRVFEDFYTVHVGNAPESLSAGPPSRCK
jgi:hypothetical protein